MFQTTMSPKVLNVEKLDKKFSSLTKSRESILGLSTWIIRHKEFYKEIVDRWLDALSKDMNALTMFYVANDVIQNCGRKKAPEFREAFGTVLEKAVSLEKVKEIKTEVIRMLTLWHERSIYDAIFFKKLQDKLNTEAELETEEELSETDIIANYKLENLVNSLKKLKTLEDELIEKESFLEDIEEPCISDIDSLIVKMDSQKELWKVDKFQKLVEDYLTLSDKVSTARKDFLINLKYTTVFYSAQYEDSKKVVHAYRIYGKKVKLLEKALSEKLLLLPEASPILKEIYSDAELSSSPESTPVISTINNEISNEENKLEISISPKTRENDLITNIGIVEDNYKSPSEEQNSVPVVNLSKSLSDEKKMSKHFVSTVMPYNIKEENTQESSDILETTKDSKTEPINKSPTIIDAAKSHEKILRSPVSDAAKSRNSEKILQNSINIEMIKNTSIDKIPENTVIEKSEFNDDKNMIPVINDSINNSEEEKRPKALNSENENENIPQKNNTLDKEGISLTSQLIDQPDSKKSSETDLQIMSDFENIDFLLEKAYNKHHTKSKASFKRKIDNLLKLKQSKACKLSNDGKSVDSNQENKIFTDPDILEVSMQITPCTSNKESIPHEKKLDVSESKVTKEEQITDSESTTSEERVNKASDFEETENHKADQSIEMAQITEKSDSCSSKSMQLSNSLQSFPDIPTELLKNILDKHRINMNLSLNVDPCNEKSSVIDGNCKQSDLNQENVSNFSVTNDNQNLSEVTSSNTLKSQAEDMKDNSQDMLTDDISNESNKKVTLSPDSASDSVVQNDNHSVKSTPLLENLQKLLECFTKKETAQFSHLKNSKTLNTLPSISVGNTLKVYNCIMQHCNNDNLKSSLNNTVASMSSDGLLSNDRFCTVETKTNINCTETTYSLNNKSSVSENKKPYDYVCSMNDNLEIIDMEVDSDDEN